MFSFSVLQLLAAIATTVAATQPDTVAGALLPRASAGLPGGIPATINCIDNFNDQRGWLDGGIVVKSFKYVQPDGVNKANVPQYKLTVVVQYFTYTVKFIKPGNYLQYAGPSTWSYYEPEDSNPITGTGICKN